MQGAGMTAAQLHYLQFTELLDSLTQGSNLEEIKSISRVQIPRWPWDANLINQNQTTTNLARLKHLVLLTLDYLWLFIYIIKWSNLI